MNEAVSQNALLREDYLFDVVIFAADGLATLGRASAAMILIMWFITVNILGSVQ